MSSNDRFTLIVVPDRDSEVKRFHLRKRWLKQAVAVVVMLLLTAAALAVHYGLVVADARENPGLRDENLKLKSELAVLREQLDHIEEQLDRVKQTEQRLFAIGQLSDPQRNLAMGPTEQRPLTVAGDNPFARSREESTDALSRRVDKASALATREEQSLNEYLAYFHSQKSLLASAPAIWPVRGFITSEFGSRMDPFTEGRVMHAGMDIATEHGKEVIAPADGLVVFAGMEGGYGNVIVIDHGYGVKTRYGHLAAIKVKAGQKVKRRELIGNVGSTGRSTGPHLHYEVRVNGIAENVRKYLLED